MKSYSDLKAREPFLDYYVHCNSTLRLTEGPWAPGKPASPFSPFIPLAPYKTIKKTAFINSFNLISNQYRNDNLFNKFLILWK